MERGYIQAKSIDKINGKLPKNSLVVMTVTGKRIEITEKDPEGGTTQIKVNLSFLQMYHYLPIVDDIRNYVGGTRKLDIWFTRI